MPDTAEAPSLPWLEPTPGGVGALAGWTTSDGAPRLASSGTDGIIQIWDPEAAVMVGSPLVGHSALVLRLVAWTGPDERLLASTSEDGTICVWDLDPEVPTCAQLAGHDGWVQAATFWAGADGTPRLASAGADGTVRLWDPLTGEQLEPPLLTGQKRLAALATWSTVDGVRLAVADDEGAITVWDPERRRTAAGAPMRHGAGVWTLAALTAPDGTPRLASGGNDGTIRIWQPDTGLEVVPPLRGHHNWVPALVAWTAAEGSARLISASTDGTVRVWDAETGTPIDVLPNITGPIALPTLTTWIDATGRPCLAVAAGGGAIRSYDLDTGQPVGEPLIGHVAGMWALVSWHEADGTRLARGGDDGLIRIWNADTGQAVEPSLAGHTAAVWAMVAWTDAGGTRLASTGDDGTVRVWDGATGVGVGEPLNGHAGWVPGLTAWRRPDGSTALASAGIDGTVRRWDPRSLGEIGDPLKGHDGWVMSIAAWQGHDGCRLASGGADGVIQVWDPESGTPVFPPVVAHDGWVRALAVWQDGTRTLLASGGYDGTVRVWDAETGAPLGPPLTGHTGRVGAVATWTAADGGARLASAGEDGIICLWDLDEHGQIGDRLGGHVAGIWALTSWRDPDGGVRLASAGQDGSVRLWDPELGHALRTIEIGPISIWGVSDAPTRRDVIGRQPLADAIADQLRQPPGDPNLPHGDGPTVVSVEGPWGCGKSTLMNLVRERLPKPTPEPGTSGRRHLTVRAVMRAVRQHTTRPVRPETVPPPAPTSMVTAWFNPWAYQSGEQVWAGLANEIIEAAAEVLYPTEADREHYWLARNLDRIDRYALGRSLRLRTRSPILGIGMVALVVPLVLALVQLDTPIELGAIAPTPLVLALTIAIATVVAAGLDTAWRRWFGKAVSYLPTDLLTGPVAEGTPVSGGDDQADADSDPLRHARTGALYLHQHNIGDLVDDLAAAGYGLVVFVDDIDRCQPGTIAEVFEAINLFLSNVASRGGLRAHFVVGLDSAVVASHLDTAYGQHTDPTVALHGDDPTPGWAFLRKLIQLPVIVPEVPDEGVRRLVDEVTAPRSAAGEAAVKAPFLPPMSSGVGRQGAKPASSRARPTIVKVPAPRTPVDTITWRSAEGHPEVRELLIRRLSGQFNRSIREAKRLINVWQFYERIMEVVEPLAEPDAMVVRARRLIILAEIVTRWPALQRGLHRHVDGRRGLQLLAAAVDDEVAWKQTAATLGLDGQPALSGLRSLLREEDGPAVADLAARLM
jgi:WD40 repeat protein